MSEPTLEDIRTRPQVKRWRIVKLEVPTRRARDASELSGTLKEAFKPLFKTAIKVEEHDGALWAQVELLGVGLKRAKYSAFVVHYPHAQFVFATQMPQLGVQSALNAALCSSFGCDSVRVLNCHGSDFDALADVALYPLSQGQFGSYRLYTALLDSDPLGREDEDRAAESKRRRIRVQDRSDARFQEDEELGGLPAEQGRFGETGGLVLDQSAPNKQEAAGSGALTRAQRAVQTKGTKALNRVELQMDAPLEWASGSVAFSCQVVVSGSGVMKGVAALTKHGMVDASRGGVAPVLSDASNVIRTAFGEAAAKRGGAAGLEGSGPRAAVRAVGLIAI
jgi:hypothetical protein